MTPKDRVLTAFAHGRTDRVPIDYSANPGIDARLKRHFGLAAADDESLRRALGVDFRSVAAPYVGPALHEDVPDRRVDMWSIRRRYIEHESGGYWEYCDFPLADATVDQVESWPMPDPDDFDYAAVREQARRHAEFCVVAGGPSYPDIINGTGMIRTMEQVLVDLATDDPAGLAYIRRRSAILLDVLRRTLEAGEGGVDLLYLGEDLGTQIGPLISVEMYRKHLRPIHRKFAALGKAFDVPVMIHSCGSSSWAFEDFLEIGITVADTLQPEAKNMAPEHLKRRFGDRMSFHGCISTAGPVAFAAPADVEADVRRTLEIMTPGGGYAMAPTHQLQDNSPTKNVLAMYDTARRFAL